MKQQTVESATLARMARDLVVETCGEPTAGDIERALRAAYEMGRVRVPESMRDIYAAVCARRTRVIAPVLDGERGLTPSEAAEDACLRACIERIDEHRAAQAQCSRRAEGT